jgi:hypothetical protein
MTDNWRSNVKILPNKAKNPENLLLSYVLSSISQRRQEYRGIIEYYRCT